MNRLLPLPALVLLLFSLPATAQVQVQVPRNQPCSRPGEFYPLPSLSSVVDSAAFHTAVAELLKLPPDVKAGRIAFAVISYNADGTVRSVKGQAPQSLRNQMSTLETLTRQQAKVLPARRKPFTVSLGITLDPPDKLSIEVQPDLLCKPKLDNEYELGLLMSDEVDRLMSQGVMTRGSIYITMVRAVVVPDGTATEIRTVQSSGRQEIDRAAELTMQRARFLPGLIYDGSPELKPVRVLIQMPITFNTGPRPPGAR